MQKVAEYRELAKQCRALAQRLKASHEREQLLQIAAAWERLATEREHRAAIFSALE